MAIAQGRITGLVLAGGRGARMGGLDKGLIPFRGEPLVAHVLRRLAPQVDAMLISANRHPVRYAAYGHPVVADAVEGHEGPLAGLLAGLSACPTAFVCAVPCDAPFVPLDLVARLAASMDDGIDLTVAETGTHRHPVFCLMRRTVCEDLATYFASGGRSVYRWIERVPHRPVSFDDERAFSNLNTRDELQVLEAPSRLA